MNPVLILEFLEYVMIQILSFSFKIFKIYLSDFLTNFILLSSLMLAELSTTHIKSTPALFTLSYYSLKY